MEGVRDALDWLKCSIQSQHRTSKAADLFAQAETLLKASETDRAAEVLRSMLAYFRTSSEEFKTLRSILFRLDGTLQRFLLPHAQPHSAPTERQRPREDIGEKAVLPGMYVGRETMEVEWHGLNSLERKSSDKQHSFPLKTSETLDFSDLDSLLATKPWRNHCLLSKKLTVDKHKETLSIAKSVGNSHLTEANSLDTKAVSEKAEFDFVMLPKLEHFPRESFDKSFNLSVGSDEIEENEGNTVFLGDAIILGILKVAGSMAIPSSEEGEREGNCLSSGKTILPSSHPYLPVSSYSNSAVSASSRADSSTETMLLEYGIGTALDSYSFKAAGKLLALMEQLNRQKNEQVVERISENYCYLNENDSVGCKNDQEKALSAGKLEVARVLEVESAGRK